jgi:hypothetical protein
LRAIRELTDRALIERIVTDAFSGFDDVLHPPRIPLADAQENP